MTTDKSNDNSVHLTLQGKGGVGKSFVTSVLAQYLKSKKLPVVCLDTDPVNKTFTAVKALNVTPIEIIKNTKIDELQFDVLMEKLLQEKSTFVVDNGASSFVPLSSYLFENDALSALEESGKKVYIHCIVTGGQAIIDTINGMNALAQASSSQNIIVWLNEYFGEVRVEGKNFEETKAYELNKNKILGIVKIPNTNPDTFGKDIIAVNKKGLTFNEAIESSDFMLMSKQRIKIFQREIYEQLDTLNLA